MHILLTSIIIKIKSKRIRWDHNKIQEQKKKQKHFPITYQRKGSPKGGKSKEPQIKKHQSLQLILYKESRSEKKTRNLIKTWQDSINYLHREQAKAQKRKRAQETEERRPENRGWNPEIRKQRMQEIVIRWWRRIEGKEKDDSYSLPCWMFGGFVDLSTKTIMRVLGKRPYTLWTFQAFSALQ